MKLGTICYQDKDRLVALVDENTVLDLARASSDAWHFSDMVAMIEAGPDALEHARKLMAEPPQEALIALSDVEHRVPLRPVQYRDCLVFEEHLLNSFAQAEKMTGRPFTIPPVWYDQPIYYKGNRMSFVGHMQTVQWPKYCDHLDLELELAVVIGKKGKDISQADAPGHIWGYTILNDVSARDAQMREMAGQLGPAKGKDFDTGNILGPWVVTVDEIPHPAQLDMHVEVNGQRWGGGNSRQMHHDFAAVIAHISASETLYPGEVIGSGTVGTGCGLEIGRKLADGDEMALTIERIGTLRNTVRRGGQDDSNT
ncbi:fumarylacetoacetate hydrolase family protein [Sulfitobacter mediterraneus]|uniref:fumarylacetoacetate hydrolase family protein n=1 Tax=Sulfitobacter mediterraneus TaxID=83219 RepID=UPI0019334DCC|nr:fumarylacetoacetate hydrolase family protein [Sulfitobacter mediterraneus]MBM1634606.1 fumarylacetoacetate hydrolase family protein [Sulfitobacter mediterraneus]MBM1642424.1 fumarylacetoacetate hydrolase family protein [Sulfitobacter mediterraneus]MBM1646472.1 fumarylacetoacetate hydrolase family protein [Sulfitobacter mediterraneus]MBM1650518.1 fumarylacetoacetate hydrolase family protein [Sulfitobacter mediterraneus]MBM1654540.1 fumarylacetoacetate hydrolase family protein [Sulfitobacter 